jgi:hypothetical protein
MRKGARWQNARDPSWYDGHDEHDGKDVCCAITCLKDSKNRYLNDIILTIYKESY